MLEMYPCNYTEKKNNVKCQEKHPITETKENAEQLSTTTLRPIYSSCARFCRVSVFCFVKILPDSSQIVIIESFNCSVYSSAYEELKMCFRILRYENSDQACLFSHKLLKKNNIITIRLCVYI